MANIHEWFKIIKDGLIVGTATDQNFAKYSEKSGRVHICNALDGQYVVVNDIFYRDDWMLALNPKSYVEFETAKVISIPEKEYDLLVKFDPEQPVFEEIVDNEKKDISAKDLSSESKATVELVRSGKLNRLSNECQKIIESGYDLILSDGISHHFSLSIQDQLNMLELQKALETGNDLVYHADGELMQFYSQEDAKDILIGANKWKQYNLALYNSLKNWIQNTEDISLIDSIRFDSEIPEKYCTIVLQSLSDNF